MTGQQQIRFHLTLLALLIASPLRAQTHAYQVVVSPDLSMLSVEARLAGNIRSLRAGDEGAVALLRSPRLCGEEQSLQVRRGSIRLPDTADACVQYEVQLDSPLGKAHGGRWDNSPLLDKLVSPQVWLWRPRINDATVIRVAFEVPDGVRVSVPWEPVPASERKGSARSYAFGKSPRSSKALSVFGEFDYREVAIPGAVLRVSLLRSDLPMDNDAIVRWIKAAASDVALAYGSFPNPSPQIVVVPVGKNNEAVPFGRVIRDGGEAVQFFIDPTRPLKEFLGDWTATHEFSHLLLPYVRDRWVSEGFATYYQNVLLARAGVYSERRAWQKLQEGFVRGKQSVPATAPSDASMSNGGVMKIYWSGAAIALMADVELRQRSAGVESLDTVLKRLQACCLPSERAWSAMELFSRLDQLTRYPVFVDLYHRYADNPGFPHVDAQYEALGITVNSSGKVQLGKGEAQASLRQSITAKNAHYAANRGAVRQ